MHRAHEHSNRGRGGPRRSAATTAFVLATAVLTGALSGAHAQTNTHDTDNAFCETDLRALGLTPDLVADEAVVNLPDQGTAQLMCADCDGLLQVELFLGPDSKGIGTALLDGTETLATLETACKAKIPNCRITAIEGITVPGTLSRHTVLGLYQTRIHVYANGQRLTVRGTASDPYASRMETATQAVFAAIKPKLLPPC